MSGQQAIQRVSLFPPFRSLSGLPLITFRPAALVRGGFASSLRVPRDGNISVLPPPRLLPDYSQTIPSFSSSSGSGGSELLLPADHFPMGNWQQQASGTGQSFAHRDKTAEKKKPKKRPLASRGKKKWFAFRGGTERPDGGGP